MKLIPGKKGLVVDHDHKTGEVRGLLCGPCNRALGFLKEDISNFNNAIQYLLKENSKSNVILFRKKEGIIHG